MTLPFENDTHKVEKRLAKRSLVADRRRNLFMIITITLAVCLMSSIAFAFSGQNAKSLEAIQGQYQSGCVEQSFADIERLAAAGKFEQWGYEIEMANVRYKDTNLMVQFKDPQMLDLMNYEPITGSYPQEENEICVERGFIRNFSLQENVGQTVRLDIGYGEADYIITGIMEKENASRQFDVFISEEEALSHSGDKPYTLRFRFAGSEVEAPEQLRADIAAFYVEMGVPEGNTFYSSNYFDMTDLYLGSNLPVYGLALLIVIACSVVIYSIFYISVMGKMREYGRLKVIGATEKQLRRVVKRERRYLIGIGIPLGLALAVLLVNLIQPGYWIWADNLKYAAVIAGLTYIVLLFATRKPLKLVGKVSAIEAVRATAYSEGGVRAVSRQLHRRLTMPRLAAMNFLRNPKKAVMTCISLGMTGIMAISIAAYVNSIDAAEMAKAGLGDGGSYLLTYKDSMVGQEFVDIQQENPLNEAVRGQLLNLPGVDYLTSYSVAGIQTDLPKNEEPLSVRGITAEQLKTAVMDGKLKEGEAEYEELLANDGVLVVKTSDNLMKKLYGADYALGDSVTFTSFSGVTKTYTVRGILDTIPGSGSVEFFVLPEEELHTLYQDTDDFVTAVNIHTTKDSSQLRQDIFDVVTDQNVEINCITDYIAELESQLQVFPLYGLLFFIFIFALLNLANTLITSLLSRQQEFGVFQSVGMSSRQLSRMLSCECLFYIGITILIMLTIGTMCSIGLCSVFDQLGLFGKITYHFPVVQILLFIAVLLAVWAVFAVFAVRYSKNQTLVERIKAAD